MSGTEHIVDLVRQSLGRRSNLEDDDIAALRATPFTVRDMRAGQRLAWDGDRPQYCALLLEGFSFRSKFSGPGRRQILSIGVRGDFIDLQNALLGVSDHNVEMLTPGRVALFQTEAIKAIALERPRVALAMWRETLIEASIFREWILNVGRRDALARVAHLLCEFALRLDLAALGSQHAYELPITQEQLADAVALTSVHVNRTLMRLEKDGFIHRSKRQITIVDWHRMVDIADFNARYLHVDEGDREP